MAEEALYESVETIDLHDLRKIAARAESAFQQFRGFAPSDTQSGYFDHGSVLPPVVSGDGFEILDISVRGELPVKEEPWAAFKAIAASARVCAERGRLMLDCGFAEKGSRQNRNGYDVVGVVLSRGLVLFDYSPNGSRAQTSPESARQFLQEVIAGVRLPLTVVDAGDDFRLKHDSNGLLRPRVVFGLNDLNPSGFICELPAISTAVDLVQRFVEVFASKRFAYSWYASGLEFEGQPPSAERSLEVYRAAVAAKLPASSHEVQMTFRLTTIDALSGVQAACGARDEVFTEFCGFDIDEVNRAVLKIHTKAAGHRLLLSLRLAEGFPRVEQALGLVFRPQK